MDLNERGFSGDEEKVEEISHAVRGILADADADIAGRKPVCRSSGRCCRFEAYRHRLYVTEAELVHFGRVERIAPLSPAVLQDSQLPHRVSLQQFFAQERFEGCPFQVDGLCTAREGRPLGCRVYFCDENAQGWQNNVYEEYHAKLKEVHERFKIPYRYVEWREGLRELVDR